MVAPHTQLVREKLEQLGYLVTELPEGDAPSADLAASGQGVGFVVEVKGRRDDIKRARQFDAGPAGRVIGSHLPIVHDDPPDLGISHADDKMITTLLGKRYVNVRGSDGVIHSAIPCYLAAYADFFRYPAIDLAVVEDPDDHARLLVNPYSGRLAEVRASRLFAFVATRTPGAIIDVHHIVPPAGYVLWGVFPRKDEGIVLAELKKRYPDRDFKLFDMCSSIGHIRVDL